MPETDPPVPVNELLNELLVELYRSLLQYAAEAWPWSTDQAEELRKAVHKVAQQQQDDVGQLVHLLQSRDHYIDFGMYPPEYTSLHYVALEYLLTQLKMNQSDVVQFGEQVLNQVVVDNEAAELVRKIVASQKEGLKELEAVSVPSETRGTAWMK